uniref:Transmembrane protein UsgS n=1 Tax=Bionectria ochroleuca TaxID=29856 RepID=A0A8H7N3I5_BIOOC
MAGDSGDKLHEQTEKLKQVVEDNIDKEKLKKAFDLSHFDLNAVLRGMQLTLVGAHRALQNPELFSNDHYKQAAMAVAVGIGIRVLVSLPFFFLKISLWVLSRFLNPESVQWYESVIHGFNFIEESVLQVPFFLMTLMRYMVPTLDNLFMKSLRWVDMTYVKKHEHEKPDKLRDLYYPNLKTYKVKDGSTHSDSTAEAITNFVLRFAKRGLISLAVFLLSYVPYVGRFVLPAASFYTFNKAVGLGPASVIFGTGIFLPKRYLVIFLQSYFSSRSLMRELLEPYFARIHFTKQQKKKWFRNREGVLFGFGLGFYILVKVPLVGVLIYGIAEASTAYLVTKITDPPPNPNKMDEFAESQQIWTNKHEFLSMDLAQIDHIHRKNSQSSPST